MTTLARKCKWCGEAFIPTDRNKVSKYCSDECKKAYYTDYYKHYKKPDTPRPKKPKKIPHSQTELVCAVCREKFFPKYNAQICCSKECSKQRNRDVSRANGRIRRTLGHNGRHQKKYEPPAPKIDRKGMEYQFLTPDEKLFYGETQMKAYADDYKVIIPEGLKKVKDRI